MAEHGPTATGTEQGMEHASSPAQAAGGPAACYRELCQFPAITRAALGAAAGGQTFLLYTECRRPDLPRRRLLRFSRHYSLRCTDGGPGIAVSGAALSADIHSQLLSQDSPSGQRRAVLSRCPLQGHELLEVWDHSGRSHSVDLTVLGKHSEVYTEGPFACLAWSHSETRLLYVAEKRRPKRRPSCPWDVPGAAGPAEEDEDEEGKQFMYHEDWGEALSTRSMPVLCILDLESSSLSVLEGVPEHLSPGQALWSPDDCGVVFVGWWHKPFRLGLSACSNRRSGIFHLDLASGCCDLLSADNGAACSPRLSPDGHRLLYLEGPVGGPHRQCLRLCLDLLLVDTEAATVTNLTAGSPEGCWELLTLQWDLLVATCSAPHHPPSLVVAMLPPAGQELPLCWVPVENTPTVPGVTWKTLMIQSPGSGQGSTAQSGPHAVFDARWRPSMAALCQLGFAVLLVNYRGSLGFGQASISSLISRVGEQDVADTQLAVEQALHREPLDPHRLALLAGSHGAFIALHLLTREPERYRACALRSPVSNLPALLGTSDIPDWRYTSLGLPYSFERVPRAEEVATMLLRSPIARAAQVQTPVLLCVGARDRRVSPTQALELYRVLRARDVPARLLWYPEGGHALTGVETEADVFKNCARWFLQHLGQPRQDRTGQHSP
ncbi:acylamino-acid-releasing enzyme-like protein [Willisornis vidua]|uniref:Acylamino-acid-releasing enzyme n=1 Tax=Willisornis vidua TaxID=1566151 RepID=A0ABQ9DPC9_9PASS|nr:acylamino-acid-releasing enzyme-like protein [Willisornis vidua]